ncbi:putative E3 ubiquitin-protein ligase MID2 [Discoglossus pictus]
MASADLQEELDCSICLNIYSDPVMLSCGHNFCQDCIKKVLDIQEETGPYSCPECRAEFQTRPALQKMRKLRNIVDRFKSNHLEQEQHVIYCSYCIDSHVLAVKTCLHCEASLCEKHMNSHRKSPEHELIKPTTSLKGRKCSIHKELLKYYCPDHNMCICVSCCLAGEHRGHKVQLLSEVSENKRKLMKDALKKLTKKNGVMDNKAETLHKRNKNMEAKVIHIKNRLAGLFGDIIHKIKLVEKKVLSEVTRHQQESLHQVSGQIKEIEKEKNEICRQMQDIEKMCKVTDPLTLLKGWESIGTEICKVLEEEEDDEKAGEKQDAEEDEGEEEDDKEEDDEEEDEEEVFFEGEDTAASNVCDTRDISTVLISEILRTSLLNFVHHLMDLGAK